MQNDNKLKKFENWSENFILEQCPNCEKKILSTYNAEKCLNNNPHYECKNCFQIFSVNEKTAELNHKCRDNNKKCFIVFYL